MAMMDLQAALPHARRAERLAAASGDDELLAEALGIRVYIEAIKDDRLDREALGRSLELENPDRESPIQLRPRLNAAVADMLFGRLDDAERLFLELRKAITESGEEHEVPYVWNVLAFITLLGGDQVTALAHLDEALRTAIAVGSETLRGYAIGLRCLVESFSGEVDAALADASESMAIFDRVGWGIGRWYPLKALAFLALSREDPAEVERLLGPPAAGVGTVVGFAAPAVFIEDLIDARLALGDVDGATRLIDGMAAGADAVGSPLAQVIAARGRALLESVGGRHEAAINAIADAERAAATLPIPSELGRTLLAKGQIFRRTRRKQAAREALTAARAVFEHVAMPLWVAKVDAELARVGLRRSSRFELTETERRIAQLAASGKTNRQIAADAFVSPKTVEDVLSRVYSKLDIRSRAELGAWMARRG
jgi:DNA-binding CsgD family transcriptional regulator